MHTDIELLKSIDLFEDLTPEEMEKILSLLSPIRVTEGEILIRRGQPAHTFFIVLSGNYMLYFKKGRAFMLHKKGDVIGRSTIIAPFHYTATAVALTKGEVLSMSGREFLRLIQGDCALGEKIMKKINRFIEEKIPFFKGMDLSEYKSATQS
jgi:CRP-like cAMP-binding protein